MNTTKEVKVPRLNVSDDVSDVKKIFTRLGQHWYVFLISVIICLMLAFLYATYTPPAYRINSRVLVTDQSKSGTKQAGALMDLGGLMGGGNSVDNEAEIIKTPDLMREVVSDMKLNVVYGQRSNLITRELYEAPFELQIIKSIDTIGYTQIDLKKVDNNRIHVETKGFDQEVSWNEPFTIKTIGRVKLVRNFAKRLNSLDYIVNVSSIDERVAVMAGNLIVSVPNKQATIVDLSLLYPVQRKGEEILSNLINKYKASNLQDKNAIADSTHTFIRQRLNVIASELGDVENKVERFKQQNKLADMSEQGKLLVQSTGEFTSELAKAETQVAVLTDLENYLKDETKNKRVFPTALLPSDLVFSNLMSQYNGLLADRDRTLMSVTAETPFVKNLDKQIATLRNGILTNIQSTKNTFVVTRNNLRSQLNQAQGQIEDVPQIEKNYLKLARNQQIKQELYIFLMQKSEETAISRTSNISIAKVISIPKAELLPVSPRKKIFYIVGLLIGLFVPLVVVIAKDFFSTTIKNKADITNNTNIPIIGEIRHNPVADNLIVANNGRSAISEQFRALRANLGFYLKGNNQNVILITSSMSGEGKSFTAINLGNILALLGKRVLLMEMDLRKPGLSSKLNISGDNGFSNYVVEEHLTAASIIKPTTVNKNLFIITSGPLPPNPGEILMSERTSQLITELKSQFDYIVMDAPPIGIITDAHSLAEFAQLTVYLVRQNITQKNQIIAAEELYQSGKINNLAIVVNDVVDKTYGYGQGYGSYEEDENVGFFERLMLIFRK